MRWRGSETISHLTLKKCLRSKNQLHYLSIPKAYIKHSRAQSKPDYKDGFEETSEHLT